MADDLLWSVKNGNLDKLKGAVDKVSSMAGYFLTRDVVCGRKLLVASRALMVSGTV